MIPELLSELELKKQPALPELDRHFRSLIKKYHPDLNKDCREWAHKKSHTIISAYQQLRPLLKAHYPNCYDQFYRPRNQGSPVAKTDPSREPLVFQILNAQIRLLIAIKHIKRIGFVSQLDPAETEGEVQWIRELHPDGALDRAISTDQATDIEGRYMIVLNHKSRMALALNNTIEFGEILELKSPLNPDHMDSKEHGYLFQQAGQSYLCPYELFDPDWIHPKP